MLTYFKLCIYLKGYAHLTVSYQESQNCQTLVHVLSFYHIFRFIFISMYTYACMQIHACYGACLKNRGQLFLFHLVLFHLCVSSGNQIRVVRHAWQMLSPPGQSHQALPHAPLKHHPAALGSLVIFSDKFSITRSRAHWRLPALLRVKSGRSSC